jgi:hypothetical protein
MAESSLFAHFLAVEINEIKHHKLARRQREKRVSGNTPNSRRPFQSSKWGLRSLNAEVNALDKL